MADKKITRQLSIYINDREVVNSLAGVNREIAKVSGQMKNLNKGSATYDDDLKKLNKTLEELKTSQSEFKEEIYGTQEAMGSLNDVASKLFTGLATGNYKLVQEGFSGIKGSLVAATKAGLAFIATPIGAGIAALTALFASAKFVFDYNKGLQEFNKQLKALGVNSQEISKVRSEIEATAETFDKEFADIATKANSLSKSFGISISEANKVIAEGLATGGAQNAEFLDSLGEYDEFFAKAGFSAQEFINVINKGMELGIYTDKLPDALKEADLSLREQTKATSDALVNAFGAAFSDDILKRIRTGEITTKQALEEIAKKSKETALTQQQQAQLTADVFKGAGEDAGGALKVLEAVGNSAQKQLSAAEKSQLSLLEANEKLNKAQADLFEIENFGDIWTGIKAKGIDSIASIVEYLSDLKAEIQPIIDIVGVIFVYAWENVKNSVAVVFNFISGILKVFSNAISTTFNFVKKILEGDFSGALDVLKNGFLNLLNIVNSTFGKIKNTIIDSVKSIIKAISPVLDALGVDVEKINKALDSFKFEDKTVKVKITTENAQGKQNNKVVPDVLSKEEQAKLDAAKAKAETERQKALAKKEQDEEKARQTKLEREKALVDAMKTLAKAELDFYIQQNQSKIKEGQLLTEELIAQETKRLQGIYQQKMDALGTETQLKDEEIEKTAKSEEEKKALLLANELNYQTQKSELELTFQKDTDLLKKQFEEEQKLIKAEQLLADNEIALENATTKFEEDRIIAQQQYEQELADLKVRKEKEFLTEKQFAALSAALESDLKDIKIEIAKAERDAKLSEYGNMFGNLATLLGENTAAGKAAALANVAISEGMAVARIWENKSLLPHPLDIASKVLGTGVAVANVISAAKKINKVKVPKTVNTRNLGFFYGGNTGNIPNLGYDSHGPVTGVVHADEWVAPKVMTQSPRYTAAFSWLESERKRILSNGFFNGGSTSTTTTAPMPIIENESQQLASALNTLNSILSAGIVAKTFIGYQQAEEIKTLQDEVSASTNNGIVS